MNQNNRLRLYTFASSSKIRANKYKTKGYIHFDKKVSFKKIQNKIQNPSWVTQHAFYPFIHFKIKINKYIKQEKRIKMKEREIFYASHIDSFIYKYYGDILNNKYNEVVENLRINKVVTAYRNNMLGKSNINFAKEVIDFIAKQSQAFVYVVDFTNFFDNLDHKYLKDKIKEALQLDTLPKDFYAVFKNISKYSYIEKEAINIELKKIYKDELPKLSRYFNEEEFRQFKRTNIKKNVNSFGIPQGAGISSVYSNIYMLEFDYLINNYVSKYDGMYRRYCDDLIIIIPIDKIEGFDDKPIIEYLNSVRDKVPNLDIQEEKTKRYFYTNKTILDMDKNPAQLDYLGFSYDGYNVKIREKSLFKYYSRAYKKVRICNKFTQKINQKAQRRSLYKNYTHLGKNKKGHGNFLSYVTRSQKIFDKGTSTNNLMEHQVKNHWRKINARLKKP